MRCCQMCYFSAKFDYFYIWFVGNICVWRVADFPAIFVIFQRKIWRIFIQDSNLNLVNEKVVKIHLI